MIEGKQTLKKRKRKVRSKIEIVSTFVSEKMATGKTITLSKYELK
jgi:hypothetical protein